MANTHDHELRPSAHPDIGLQTTATSSPARHRTYINLKNADWTGYRKDSNAHHSLWHSGTTDSRGNQLADSVSISSFAVLNADSPTRLPANADPSSPDVSLASAYLITSSEWQTHTTMSSDHLPILIGLQTTATSSPARHRTYINLKKSDWTGYRQEIERKLSSRHLPPDCQKDEKLFRAIRLKAASHHIPTGRRKL